MNPQDGRAQGPRWLAPAVLVLLGLQLCLLYVQGGLLHRQDADLRALREDVQYLSELIETGNAEGASYRPSRQGSRPKPRFQKASLILEEEPEPAAREVQQSRKEAQKAVQEAKEIQQKTSVEAAIQKTEEKARMEQGRRSWQPLLALALGLLVVVGVARVLVRRRS